MTLISTFFLKSLFQKYLEKRNIFSLNDDEELTHYGQTLSEIETFDKPIDSDDEEIDGRISGKVLLKVCDLKIIFGYLLGQFLIHLPI